MHENLDFTFGLSLTEKTFNAIAKYSITLAIALQNAAPPTLEGLPPSVIYLQEMAKHLQQVIMLTQNNESEQKSQLLLWVKNIIELDKTLREQHNIAAKFRFVQEQLKSLLINLEQGFSELTENSEQAKNKITDAEMPVYVHLFNTQGIKLITWQNMLSARAFYEHSVNRPIYAEKKYIESLMRAKENKAQHAYLTVAINKADLLSSQQVDSLGNPLVKIREGSLLIQRLMTFTHNDCDYKLSSNNALILQLHE